MEILSIDQSPFYELECEIVTLRRERKISHVPCFRAQVDGLPEGIDALIATSDLQGLEPPHRASGEPRLLGQVLADELEVLIELGEVPPLDRVGAILAGDLFARPRLDRRGGSGDVRGVWLALACRCRWVAGVAGNHDLFGPKPSVPDFQEFCGSPGVYFLDGEVVELDGLRIGGLSGVVGRPTRPWRRGAGDRISSRPSTSTVPRVGGYGRFSTRTSQHPRWKWCLNVRSTRVHNTLP